MNAADSPSSPFALLGLPCRFHMDAKALDAAYFEALARTHPDRFTDPIEQADAAELSAQINQAYHTLRNPLLRAQALLPQLQEDQRETALPPDFLMQMMEVRETLEEAELDGDKKKLGELAQWAQARRHEHLQQLEQLLDQTPSAISDPATVTAAREQMNMLRYIDRMLEQMPTSHDA